MSGRHTMTLDYQIKQSREVKRLKAENERFRAALLRARAGFVSLAVNGAGGVERLTVIIDAIDLAILHVPSPRKPRKDTTRPPSPAICPARSAGAATSIVRSM